MHAYLTLTGSADSLAPNSDATADVDADLAKYQGPDGFIYTRPCMVDLSRDMFAIFSNCTTQPANQLLKVFIKARRKAINMNRRALIQNY